MTDGTPLNREQTQRIALEVAAARYALSRMPESSGLLDKVRAIESAVENLRRIP